MSKNDRKKIDRIPAFERRLSYLPPDSAGGGIAVCEPTGPQEANLQIRLVDVDWTLAESLEVGDELCARLQGTPITVLTPLGRKEVGAVPSSMTLVVRTQGKQGCKIIHLDVMERQLEVRF